MSDSILNSVKKVLGLEPDYTAFDLDITMHINTVFLTLNQLGLGPTNGFMIEDAAAVWHDFIGEEKLLNAVKSYTVVRVRMMFDPPTTSFAINAMQEQARELEWRLNVLREGVVHPSTAEQQFVIDGGGISQGGS